MKRIKSNATWIAILAQVVVILQITGVLTLSEVEMVNGVATAVIQILVLAGILVNPTTTGITD